MPRLIALLLILLASAAQARVDLVEVTHVSDGDTLWVRGEHGAPRPVRIQGIDAPELCQPHGPRARDALAARVLHTRVRLHARGRDDYGRTLARVRDRSGDVGAWLVAAGHAWSPGWRGRAGPYAALEQQARAARLGLWAAREAEEPRSFRRRHGPCAAGH